MRYLLNPYKRYFHFQGRTNRKEYWMYILLLIITILIGAVIDFYVKSNGYLISVIYTVSVIPFLSIQIRRLHDINKPWVWVLINLIPIIGEIWFIILLCSKGVDKNNKYNIA